MNELPRILGISRQFKSLQLNPVFSQKSPNGMETIISTHVILDGEEKWFKLICCNDFISIHVMGVDGVILFVPWSCLTCLPSPQSIFYCSMWIFEVFKVVTQFNWFGLQAFWYFDWLGCVRFIRSGVLRPAASLLLIVTHHTYMCWMR